MTDDAGDPFPWFTRACRRHFAFLVEEHGYGLAIERSGAECRAVYRRGGAGVVLDYSLGLLPDLLIERTPPGEPARVWHLRDVLQALGERPPYEQAPANHGLQKQMEAGDAGALKAYIREHFEALHTEMDEALERRATWLRRALTL